MNSQDEWVTIGEAVKILPVAVAKSTIRRWLDDGKYNIVAKRFCGRIVIRKDTLPKLTDYWG